MCSDLKTYNWLHDISEATEDGLRSPIITLLGMYDKSPRILWSDETFTASAEHHSSQRWYILRAIGLSWTPIGLRWGAQFSWSVFLPKSLYLTIHTIPIHDQRNRPEPSISGIVTSHTIENELIFHKRRLGFFSTTSALEEWRRVASLADMRD